MWIVVVASKIYGAISGISYKARSDDGRSNGNILWKSSRQSNISGLDGQDSCEIIKGVEFSQLARGNNEDTSTRATLGWCYSVESAIFCWVRVADRKWLAFWKGSNGFNGSDFAPIEIASVEGRCITDPSLWVPRDDVDLRICSDFRKIRTLSDGRSNFCACQSWGGKILILPISEQIVEGLGIRNVMENSLNVEINSSSSAIANSLACSIIVNEYHWLVISVQSSSKRCVVIRARNGKSTENSHTNESSDSCFAKAEWRLLLRRRK